MEQLQLKTGDLVIYSAKGICKVSGIEDKSFGNEILPYYVLSPIYDSRSTYFVPVDYNAEKVHLRPALNISQAKALLDYARTAEALDWITSPNERKQAYDRIYKAGTREEKICLLKALYRHEQQQKAVGKALYAGDSKILRGCEMLIAEELAFVLQLTSDEVLACIYEKAD